MLCLFAIGALEGGRGITREAAEGEAEEAAWLRDIVVRAGTGGGADGTWTAVERTRMWSFACAQRGFFKQNPKPKQMNLNFGI